MRRSLRSRASRLGLVLALSGCSVNTSPMPATFPDNADTGQWMARSTAPSPLAVSPLAHIVERTPGVYESDNWAGYAVVGTAFTDARGSWTVPTVDCAADPNDAASFWVGIDGWSNDTVEQTGTESQCNGVKPVAYPWYELFPKAGVTIKGMGVSPGDNMDARVHYNGSAFVVSISDLTTGKTFTTTAAVPKAKRASAEWITEWNGGSALPDFDVVRYGKDFTGVNGTNSATDATTSGPIAAFGKRVQEAIMGNGKKDEAVPSLLSTDGTSFTITYWNP